MIIDAKNMILGRLASFTAKKLLLGEKIDIVNCNDVIIVGKKKLILDRYKRKTSMGGPIKGPFFPLTPERFVKRTIRGMLPHKQYHGRIVFKRIKCYRDIPEALKNKEIIKLDKFNIYQTQNLNFLKVSDVCKYLKGK